MQTNKELAIKIIAQDLRQNQLILGLDELGLDGSYHVLDLSSVVSQLMGIPKGQTGNHWSEVYDHFMYKAPDHDIDNSPNQFIELATECYKALELSAEIDKKRHDREKDLK